MDFALSEEQTAIYDMAKGFGESHIAPFAREWDAAGTIPRELFWLTSLQVEFEERDTFL